MGLTLSEAVDRMRGPTNIKITELGKASVDINLKRL